MQYDKPDFHNAKYYGTDLAASELDRLRGAVERVYKIMIDGKKRTLDEIAALAKCPAASAHRHLSTLRTQFGFCVEKERITATGLWVYFIAGGGMGEHTRKKKKMKPIGNPELFGEMMRCVYAMAKTGYTNFDMARIDSEEGLAMAKAGGRWLADLAWRIRKGA